MLKLGCFNVELDENVPVDEIRCIDNTRCPKCRQLTPNLGTWNIKRNQWDHEPIQCNHCGYDEAKEG